MDRNVRGFSRRAFLKAAAVAGVVGSAGAIIPPANEAWAQSNVRRDSLQQALEKIFGHNVEGIEKNHQIPSRLAANLANIGGRPRGIVEVRRQLLLRAAADVEKAQQRRPGGGSRSVTRNLNELLDALRVQPVSSRLLQPLIDALLVTTLFATRGIHFGDTREAHRRFRRAQLALKDRESIQPIGSRVAEKRRLLEQYRSAMAERRRQLTFAGRFPEDVTIRAIWIMNSGSQRAG